MFWASKADMAVVQRQGVNTLQQTVYRFVSVLKSGLERHNFALMVKMSELAANGAHKFEAAGQAPGKQ